MAWGKTLRKWTDLPVRTARKGSAHECSFCMKPIAAGDRYYDGGPSKRAHVEHVGEMKAQSGKPKRIKVTYMGIPNEAVDDALKAALTPLGYARSDSGFTFETKTRDVSFRLEE